MNLEALIVPMKLDSSEFTSGLNQAKTSSQETLASLGKGMQRAGAGLAIAGLPFAAFVTSANDAASNLSESQNAVNVVFGESSSIILDYSKTASTQVGLAASVFNQAGAVMGAMLQNLGFDQEAAAEETLVLTERAADMASIFNTDVSQAMGAIQSALKGEFNPLEQYGVKLNMAAINQRVLAMGLADTATEITEEQKATAALAIIMEQTDKVAGDFLNTQDGWANSSKIMTSQLEDMKAELGAELQPVMLDILTIVRDLLVAFKGLSPEVKKGIGIFALLMASLVVLGPVIAAIGTVIGFLSVPVLAVGAGIVGFGLIVYNTFQSIKLFIETLRAVFAGEWQTVDELTGGLASRLAEIWEGIVGTISSAVERIKGWLAGLFDGVSIPDWLSGWLGGGGSGVQVNQTQPGGRASGGRIYAGNAYQLHRDEVVVPDSDSRVFKTNGAGGGNIDYSRLAEEIVRALRPVLQARPSR